MLIAVIAIAAFGLATGAFVALVRSASPPDVVAQPAPTRSPTAEPTAMSAPPSEPESPKPRPEKRNKPRVIGQPADLGGLPEEVAQIREIPLRRRLNSRLVSEGALADKVSELAFAEQDPEEVDDNEQLLVALRLAPEDFDLGSILEDLYREQVLGLYVPEEDTLYVRRRGKGSPGQQATTAHEITHALQDQQFDMVKLQKRHEDDADASLAVLSLIEGDAVLTQQLWAQTHLTSDEQQQAAMEGSGGGSALDRAPEYLRASLFFPYARGGFFVADLYRTGGYDAVNEAFRNPPTTTEQILHPDRYREGDERVEVSVGTKPGAGWKRATKYAFGEFDLREFFGALGEGRATAAGEGWDGGEIRSWSNGEDTAVGTVLAFDTPDDATEVCDALPEWYAEVAGGRQVDDGLYAGDRDHLAVACTATQVRFGLAPSPQTARRLAPSP